MDERDTYNSKENGDRQDSDSTRKFMLIRMEYDLEDKIQPSNAFCEEDLVGVACPHDDALVVVGGMADFNINRGLVDKVTQ